MKQMSAKRRARYLEAKPIRDGLIEEVGECENCGRSPGRRQGVPVELSQLCCHEIAGGPNRQKCLDKRFAILCLCWGCNGGPFEDRSQWPESRQLALLASRRPLDFDLVAYLELTSPSAPRRIEIEEIGAFMSDELLKVDEVAERMRVNRRTAQSWIDSGQLVAIDVRPEGAQRAMWRVTPEDLLRFIHDRKKTREDSHLSMQECENLLD